MTNKKSLLIVDDSKVSRMMISAIVKDKYPDLIIFEAANGDDAKSIVDSNEINFFSIDYNMPGINGIDLISHLKKSLPNAKYTLLTANIQDSTHKKVESVGAVCINKPISEESITNMVEYFYSE